MCGDILVEASELLNVVGYALNKLTHAREKYPSLDALQDLIADWFMADYANRAALTVMASMDQRKWIDDRNYFYAMLGAVSNNPHVRTGDPGELFMRACEEKGDYSFIFTTAPRDGWRPRPGILPSILPWHCYGHQAGHVDKGVWLDDVVILRRTELTAEAEQLIKTSFDGKDAAEALQSMGFTGEQVSTPLGIGLFFPQQAVADEALVLISSIRYAWGSPGLAIWNKSYIPGVFVGSIRGLATTSYRLSKRQEQVP